MAARATAALGTDAMSSLVISIEITTSVSQR